MADPQSIQESQNLSMFLANHNRITQAGPIPPSQLTFPRVGRGNGLAKAEGVSVWTAAISASFVGSFPPTVVLLVRLYNSCSISFQWIILGSFGGLFMSRQGARRALGAFSQKLYPCFPQEIHLVCLSNCMGTADQTPGASIPPAL